MGSSGASSGGSFRGAWAGSTVYAPGDMVTYNNALYVTATGAAADVAPVVSTILYSGTPASSDAVDATDYQFRALCTISQRIRITGICYYKVASQTAVPHALRIYNPSVSTTTPILSATVVGEVAGSTGQRIAPVVADLPAGTYAFTLVSGASETGYAYQASFGFPLTSGSVSMTAGGFIQSHANITTVESATTYYSGVCPRWEEPSASWTLVARMDSVVASTDRDLYIPAAPA